MTVSFVEKGDLEMWLEPKFLYTDYTDIFESTFDQVVDKDLSFIVTNAQGRMVGVSLNLDTCNKLQFSIDNQLSKIYEFVEFVERPFR